jgi:hypothetical protein
MYRSVSPFPLQEEAVEEAEHVRAYNVVNALNPILIMILRLIQTRVSPLPKNQSCPTVLHRCTLKKYEN